MKMKLNEKITLDESKAVLSESVTYVIHYTTPDGNSGQISYRDYYDAEHDLNYMQDGIPFEYTDVWMDSYGEEDNYEDDYVDENLKEDAQVDMELPVENTEEIPAEVETQNVNPIELGLSTVVSDLIKDEWEAIDGYNGAIATFAANNSHEDVIKVLTDIRDEEMVHIGQLEKCLTIITPSAVEIDNGSQEAEEQLVDAGVEVQVEESLDENFKPIKFTTSSGKEVIIVDDFGNGYQVATKDEFGNFNPWQKMNTREEQIGGETYSFVTDYEIVNFDTVEEAKKFAEKHYGELKEQR